MQNWLLALLVILIVFGTVGGLFIGRNWGYNERGAECDQAVNILNSDWQNRMNTALTQRDSDWQTRLTNEIGALNENWQNKLNSELNRLNNEWQIRLVTERDSAYRSGEINGYNRGLSDDLSRCPRCPPPGPVPPPPPPPHR